MFVFVQYMYIYMSQTKMVFFFLQNRNIILHTKKPSQDLHPKEMLKMYLIWFYIFPQFLGEAKTRIWFLLPLSYEDPSDSVSLTRSGLFASSSLSLWKEGFFLLLLLGLFGSYFEEAKKLRASTTSDTTGLMLGCSWTHIAEIASAWYSPLTGYCPWSNGSTIFGKFLLSLNNGRACEKSPWKLVLFQ